MLYKIIFYSEINCESFKIFFPRIEKEISKNSDIKVKEMPITKILKLQTCLRES